LPGVAKNGFDGATARTPLADAVNDNCMNRCSKLLLWVTKLVLMKRDPLDSRRELTPVERLAVGDAGGAGRVRIPGEVARESAMMSPTIPI